MKIRTDGSSRGAGTSEGRPVEARAQPAATQTAQLSVASVLAGAADAPGVLLSMQRTVGNQAVARFVREARIAPVLARYESPEHVAAGDSHLQDLDAFLSTPEGSKWVETNKLQSSVAGLHSDPMLAGRKIKVGTLQLSPGEVIALVGDLYETPADLKAANPKEVEELLAAIRQESSGLLKGGKANARYQEITLKYRAEKDSYAELAKRNTSHFAPANRQEWAKLHKQAIDFARRSRTDKALLEDALLYDAGGGHFLTDAFASGHLFDKSKVEAAIVLHLQQNKPRATNPEMQAYHALVESKNSMHLLVLKNIHDQMNGAGFEVTNKKGMRWKTFGDNHLRNAQETQHIMALAVAISRRQIMDASKGEADPQPEEVLDLLPDDASMELATKAAIDLIPQAVHDVDQLMYNQRESSGAALPKGPLRTILGPVIESNLGAIGNPQREREIDAAQKRAHDTGLPQPVPQFEIFKF